MLPRGRASRGTRVLAPIAIGAACLLGAQGAAAAELLSTEVSAGDATSRNCIARSQPGEPGVVQRSATQDASGFITARLSARSGDWDVAIFDKSTGRRVAGSAFLGASETAQSFAAAGQDLVVQACRLSGSASTARLEVESDAVAQTSPEKLSLVRVSVPSRARKQELTNLGLDLTEHGGDGFVEVVLHGAADAKTLRASKFTFTTEVADLVAQGLRDRAADRRTAARTARASSLPSGRETYRRLADYNQEMKTLAAQNPSLVKPITLPEKTLTGLPVEGIEITTDVNARDGKPVFLQMGAHHAREWPSSEHAMEWAYELVNGYKANDPRARRLVESTRTIVVPIVNPEGFNTSREAASSTDNGDPDNTNFARPYEYQRKNCRVNNPAADNFDSNADDDPRRGTCAQAPNNGGSQFGVDPNRNYGGFWGGPGASPSGPAPGGDYAQDYRGTGPFSEPETENVRRLVSSRQVTTLITNHTFSNLVLRPPGIAAQGPPVDEPVYKALGDEMATKNGYASQPSYMLYDTTGGTEDWTYYATGGLGFTFEIGPDAFHPPYADTVAEYEGTTESAGGRGGNREAYFVAQENTADASRHSVVSGAAPSGAVLRLKKSFTTFTSDIIDADGEETGRVLSFPDTLETTMEVPASGRFDWHINPSTRPVAAQERGRQATGEPSPTQDFPQRNTPQPPCDDYDFDTGEGCGADGTSGYSDEVVFEVPPNGGGVDNEFAKVRLAWLSSANDIDLEVYRAGEDDKPVGRPVAVSAQGGTRREITKIGPAPEPGRYVARVINYDSDELKHDLTISFEGPEPFKPATTESWTLTCETPDGQVRASQALTIARGERKPVDFGSACAPGGGTSSANVKPCLSTKGGFGAKRIARARLGRTRTAQRRALIRARTLRSRRSIDRYCVKGGGHLRIAHPTSALSKRLKSSTRGAIRSRAIVLVTTNRRLILRGLRVGSKASTARRVLARERRYRIGKSGWYVARGKRGVMVYRVSGGRIREMGVANRRLTASRRGTARLLRGAL